MTIYTIQLKGFRLKRIQVHLNKRINLHFGVALLGLLLLLLAWKLMKTKPVSDAPAYINQMTAPCPLPPVVRYTMSDFRFASPLLLIDRLADPDTNDQKMNAIRNGFMLILNGLKEKSKINTASIYFRDLKSGKFIDINEGELYDPASLVKIPLVMSLMRDAEVQPGLLKEESSCESVAGFTSYFPPDETIRLQTKYKISELMYRTITMSDNNADQALINFINRSPKGFDTFYKLFADLGLPKPDISKWDLKLTASGFSRFMRVLYNATYLSNEDADLALSVLTKTKFKDGFVKGLPPNVLIAHKFGERGYVEEGTYKELHESAIIYINNSPILLTVMTRGKDFKELAEVLAQLSKYVYDSVNEWPS